MTSPAPPPAGPPADSEPPPLPPDSTDLPLPGAGPGRLNLGPLGLDRLGVTQAIGGLALGLIALFSSYDHLSFSGRNLPIPQQWGIPLIAASVAIVFVDAQLASRSRLRAAQDAARMADEAARERAVAAEARERQGQATARQDRCALLSARVLLEPSDSNRARLQAFLSLIAGERPPEEGGAG